MLETGKVQKTLSEMVGQLRESGDCSNQGFSLAPISLGKTALILVVLAGGMALSLVVLSCEAICYNHYRETHD